MGNTVRSPGEQWAQSYTNNPSWEDYYSGEYDDLTVLANAQPCRPVVVQSFLRVFVPVLYSLVLLLGVAGNGMVMAVIGRSRGRTATDTFLLHLAASDLLLALTLPFWSAEAVSGWHAGIALCKVVGAVFALNLYSGILLLVCISFDRYLAIVHAVHMYRRRRPVYVHATCAAVWLFCTLLAGVDLVFRGEFTSGYLNGTVCTYIFPTQGSGGWKLALRLAHQLVGFALPLAVMVYCYSRIFRSLCRVQRFERQKTLRVVVVVVAVFLGCWAPYNALLLADTLEWLGAIRPSCSLANGLDIGRSVTQSLGLLHSCLNPLLYAFVGVRFRREMAGLLGRLGCPGVSRRTRQVSRGKRGSSGTSDTSTTYSTLW
ncbi:C-X-C chemokine receptor type 3-like [Pristis pectinata]|uniref:C-X-C chemokine receptor type 3-like n=1 Tax=Pristis pectinata TaxID=685728 RepID=UPI00223DED43|nr:C-X-C chemokine receptor type 3-like [Pristis pectinata]